MSYIVGSLKSYFLVTFFWELLLQVTFELLLSYFYFKSNSKVTQK